MSDKKIVRTRYAPSPTGMLHVGGLRTALYAWLVAHQNNGVFALRIEDTDQKRFVEGAVEAILRSLHWAGIDPDEGVVMMSDGTVGEKGDKGPYTQSKRLPIYKEVVDKLVAEGNAYPCFCTSERLEELKNAQNANNEAPGYDGLCREISKAESEKRIAAGEPHTIRMKMPKDGETTFEDAIRGTVTFKNELVDDQVILKTDGFPTYHLAVVVDDHFMELTHVIRGEEWLSSTPKHIQLYKYLGWDMPLFAHLPLLLNADRSKLSKRQGDVSAESYIEKGYLAEAMVNFIAFLGWNPGGEKELYTLPELVESFSLERVAKAGAFFNLEKLDWYNREYLKTLPLEDLGKRLLPFLQKTEWWKEEYATKYNLANIVTLERERVNTLAELAEAVKFAYELPEYEAGILVWKKSTKEEAVKMLTEVSALLNTFSVQPVTEADYQAKIGEWVTSMGYSNGPVLWPLRVALSGSEQSPGPFAIAAAIGFEKTQERINSALEKLSHL